VIILLLSRPKELLVELGEDFPHSAIPRILFIRMGDSNGCVEHSHDKLCVISFLVYVVFDLDIVGENQIVLLIVKPIEFSDDFPHARSASTGLGLRVEIGQVDEDVADHVLYFDDKNMLYLLKLLISNLCSQQLVVLNSRGDFAKN
jgi:hypothetical protein